MAQKTKWFLYKHEDLSSDPRDTKTENGKSWVGGGETKGFWGLLAGK